MSVSLRLTAGSVCRATQTTCLKLDAELIVPLELAAIFDNRYYRVASWIGILLLASATALVAVRGNWVGATVLTVYLAASFAFVAWERRLPSLFDTLFVLAAIINAAGWVWNLYNPVWGFDEFAHFFTTFAGTLSIGYLLLYELRDHYRQHPTHYVIVVTSIGVTLGAWWEVLEWLFMKQLVDPVGDIIVDSVGAVLAALLSLLVLKKGRIREDEVTET